MWGSGGSGKVPEGPGIPGREKVNQKLVKCIGGSWNVIFWLEGSFRGSWKVLEYPDDSKGDLEDTGGWGISFSALDVFWGFGGPEGFG